MTNPVQLLRRMHREYQASVGLDPEASYLHGTPVRPVVPLDVGVGGLFILGAYPSARFITVEGITDVPVADNLAPFENERWFDGTRIRFQPSARELEDLFLAPLQVDRADCWITDLVKVFLFKPGHARRYSRLGAEVSTGYSRERFFELGRLSLPWIEEELLFARPQLVITLGAEVAGVIHGIKARASQVRLLVPKVSPRSIGEVEVAMIHCPHPGILMRGEFTRWPARHRDEFIPVIRDQLSHTA